MPVSFERNLMYLLRLKTKAFQRKCRQLRTSQNKTKAVPTVYTPTKDRQVQPKHKYMDNDI